MGRPDFALCAAYFIGNNTEYPSRLASYVYDGRVRFLPKNSTSQITYKGCLDFCGHGAQYYHWADIASTITTWTLPVVGVILQAPFESNEFLATIFVLARWIGNPIASLSYTLWNMKVTGKCALLVDMAVPSDAKRELVEPGTSDYSQIRDSLYILAAMNQFSVNAELNTNRREAETLLRIALFSRGLQSPGTNRRFLPERRQKLAEHLRKFRKRGVVPVYISTMWFLFSLSLSIQGAFNLLGTNATAHDLALGFLLGWLPTLCLSFIVDRNFTHADECRQQLNHLIIDVGNALEDEAGRNQYIQTYQGRNYGAEMCTRIECIREMPELTDGFFVKYAGQGRLRWHYGVAHSVLTDIERNFIREKGRGWLSFNEQDARSNLVLGDTDKRGLIWFDPREAWQVLSSFIIVVGTITGAFILSFFEPTVGLGCRSGGYLIFAIIAFTLLILESVLWSLISVTESNPTSDTAARYERVLDSLRKVINSMDSGFTYLWSKVATHSRTKKLLTQERLRQRKNKRVKTTLRKWAEVVIFRPMEVINLAWLCYIVMAQTIGSYRTCYCQASVWGGAGYIDFNDWEVADSPKVKITWSFATALACTIIGVSMIYVVIEWCLQSHLSTENYEAALRGLRRTRTFRRVTYPYRMLLDMIIRRLWTRRSVVWTYEVTYKPPEEMPAMRDRLPSVPQISISDESTARAASSESVAVTEEYDDGHLQTARSRGDSFSSAESPQHASHVDLLHEDRV